MDFWIAEKAVFINNLYREAAGKELKIAHSQGCSRLLERLMLVSTAGQLKRLMKAFTGQWVFDFALMSLRGDSN
jgi:nucleolar protein 9